MIKDHSDSERGNPLSPLHGLLFPISSKVFFICRITLTTAFITSVVEHWLEQEIPQWLHHEESTVPWTGTLQRNYILAAFINEVYLIYLYLHHVFLNCSNVKTFPCLHIVCILHTLSVWGFCFVLQLASWVCITPERTWSGFDFSSL